MKRYIYLKAIKKVISTEKKESNQIEITSTAENPKQSNNCIIQGSLSHISKSDSAQSVDFLHQEMLLPPSKKNSVMVSTNAWYELHNKILSRNQHSSIRTLMFTGIDHGVGVTTAVVNFSRAMAKTSGRNILIIDINLRTPQLHSIFKIGPVDGITELFLNNRVKTCAIKKVGKGQLSVITSGNNFSEGVNYFEREPIDELIKEALDKFDFIILDAAPSTKFADPLAVCSLVDGVLLVIQAGKTRPQQALRAKKELEGAGGNLLGIILNKRKYYIPEWIYRRL